jgi:transcriptional regulator GlxA family with amidase domain
MAMSPRNFARVFEREIGMTPGKFVELVRLEAARCQLEQSKLLLDEIATQCGFGNPKHLRRTFQRRLKVSPRDYRARFRSTQGLERSAPSGDGNQDRGTTAYGEHKFTPSSLV